VFFLPFSVLPPRKAVVTGTLAWAFLNFFWEKNNKQRGAWFWQVTAKNGNSTEARVKM